MGKLDAIDRKILGHLQADAGRSVQAVADDVGLSQNACWRRIKIMEESGVITGRVAVVNPEAIGLGVTVFVMLRTNNHSEAWLTTFSEGVARIPEVVEFYRMSGEIDYLLKVLVSDIQDYDRVYKKLIAVAPLSDVSSAFAMERLKSTTALPLDVR